MKWKEFHRVVEVYKEEVSKDDDYSEWLDNKVWKNFANGEISIEDVKEVVRFLIEWKMGRVIGKIKKKSGEEKFLSLGMEKAKVLNLYSDLLRNLRFGVDFNIIDGQKEIKDVFKDLNEVFKPTSTSKLMHLVYPNLFIMWDDAIRANWGVTASVNGYITFLLRMQVEYRELLKDFAKLRNISHEEAEDKMVQELNSEIGENLSVTRWIDIYNWTKFTYLNEEQ